MNIVLRKKEGHYAYSLGMRGKLSLPGIRSHTRQLSLLIGVGSLIGCENRPLLHLVIKYVQVNDNLGLMLNG